MTNCDIQLIGILWENFFVSKVLCKLDVRECFNRFLSCHELSLKMFLRQLGCCRSFFTWWQGVLIFYLKAHGIIEDIGSWTGEEVANGLIDYCICIEMVGFAVAHSFTFTYKEYLPSTVEEAIATYTQVQQDQQDSNSDEDGGGDSGEGRRRGGPTYHPPETLSRPMKFKDAFWSSTVPKETLQDIRRLQNGVDRAAAQISDPGTISLQEIQGVEESCDTRGEHPQHVV
jgi:Organic solute transporter Ostalpha